MLLTAGCSFVWGDELKGFDDEPPTHQELTWTHLLAERLGVEYTNLGICGSCNDRIFRHVVDYLHDPTLPKPTHVVVMWSAWQRCEMVESMSDRRETECALNRPEDATQFSPLRLSALGDRRKRKVLMEYFEELYDSRTDIMHGLTQMKALELICKGLDIPLIQGVFHNRCWANVLSVLNNTGAHDDGDAVQHQDLGDTPRYRTWVKNTIGSLESTSRVGLGRGDSLYEIARKLDDVKEHGHPGEHTQVVWAELMQQKFDDMIS